MRPLLLTQIKIRRPRVVCGLCSTHAMRFRVFTVTQTTAGVEEPQQQNKNKNSTNPFIARDYYDNYSAFCVTCSPALPADSK